MKEFLKGHPFLREYFFIWVPLVLWLTLWLSISPGRIQNVSHPERFIDFVNGIRALFPFIAGSVGLVVLTMKFRKQLLNYTFFTGPLGFLFVYAAIGVVATLASPDKSQSIYWAGSYISVPVVLWAIGSGSNSLAKVERTVDLTMAMMVPTGLGLLIFAFAELNLADALLRPELLERCQFGTAWFTNSSGYLRSTGVGRYAALAALVSISGIAGFNIVGRIGAGTKTRLIWGLIFLAVMLLLLSSGARSSFVAFCAAVTLMILLYWGKKAFILGAFFSVIFIPVILITGVLDTMWQECLLQSDKSAPSTPVHNVVPMYQSTGNSIPTTGNSVPSRENSLLPTENSLPPTRNSLPPTANYRLDSVSQKSTGLEYSSLVNFSGRTVVWENGFDIIKDSPIIGRGFHADRIILEAHIHNSLIHSLIQTGILGTTPIVIGILFAWFLFLKSARKLNTFSHQHKTRIVLAGSVLVFFSVRSIAESSGAFFGIDWLVLAPVLLYLSVANNTQESSVDPNSSI